MQDHDEERGWQPIGNPISKIANSQKAVDSTPTAPATNIATTGLPDRAPAEPRLIGLRPSGTGVAKSRTIGDLLTGNDPWLTDQTLEASLPRSIVSALTERRREWIGAYGYECEIVGYDLVAPIPDADRAAAEPVLRQAISGAPDQVIKSELARLRVSTKARAESADDLAMGMQAYADVLSEYPPDVVRAACRGWSRREKWFPALAELIEELDRGVRRRRALASVLI